VLVIDGCASVLLRRLGLWQWCVAGIEMNRVSRVSPLYLGPNPRIYPLRHFHVRPLELSLELVLLACPLVLEELPSCC
jgi:hypothetical protein